MMKDLYRMLLDTSDDLSYYLIIIYHLSFLFMFLQHNFQCLIIFLDHTMPSIKAINWLSPSVFLITSQRCIITFFCSSFVSFVEMPISMSFLVIFVLIYFQLVESMSLSERVIIFPKDRKIFGIRICLYQGIKL